MKLNEIRQQEDPAIDGNMKKFLVKKKFEDSDEKPDLKKIYKYIKFDNKDEITNLTIYKSLHKLNLHKFRKCQLIMMTTI